jgi:hypothetical protein
MNSTYQVFFFSPNFVISKICNFFNTLNNNNNNNKFKENLPIFLGQKPTKFVGKETLIAIV